MSAMATYRGHVRTRQDAILLFEACQLDVLPKILRRLSRKERKNVISPGAVFVWDEVEAGIQRWTDGRLWGSITLSEEFIVRREMERKARRLSLVQESTAMDVDGEASRRGSDGDVQMEEGTTDDYHYKKNGLIRRSMTITSNGRQLHLVTYDNPTCGFTPELPSPTTDSLLKHLIEEKIATRSAPPPSIYNELRFRPESLQGGPVMCPEPVFGTHFDGGTIPSAQQIQALSAQNVHWGVPPAQIHQLNDTVMNLYRLLASISQSPTNIPQVPQPDSSYRQTPGVCATSASMVPGPDTLAAPPPSIYNELRFRPESLQGGPVMCPEPVFGTHFDGGTIPSAQQIQALSAQNVHWGVPPAQIHQLNDTVMNLYRLLASISQSPTNIPQVPQPDSSYRQTPGVCATSASMVPGPDTLAAPHAQYLQMVQSPPSPPRSPKIHHAASPPSFIDVQPAMINTAPSNSFQSSHQIMLSKYRLQSVRLFR